MSKTLKLDFSMSMSIIYATGRAFYGDERVVVAMPPPATEVGKLQLHFFQTGRYTRGHEVQSEYVARGLVPVDPYTLCVFNAANSKFANTKPNATYWVDDQDKVSWLSIDEESIVASRNVQDFGDDWWFVGISK